MEQKQPKPKEFRKNVVENEEKYGISSCIYNQCIEEFGRLKLSQLNEKHEMHACMWWVRSIFVASKKLATKSYGEISKTTLSGKDITPKPECEKVLFILRGREMENVEVQGLYDGAIINLACIGRVVPFGAHCYVELYPLINGY